MERLVDKLKTRKMCLIVSLPWNSYELAKSVWEAGADAIKVHINLHHQASNNDFGTLEDNREVFEKILKDSPVPVGIVPGTNPLTIEDDLDELVRMGFDFISLYNHHMPASLMTRTDIGKFYGVSPLYTQEEVDYIASSPLTEMLEMAFIKVESPLERMSAYDVQKYRHVCSIANCPTILPTQHLVKPCDVKLLHEIGVNGLMIGAIVTTNDFEMIKQKTIEFRKAIDQL